MSSPISGFTAIPNPQMLAFMPIQSYLMMYFAGAGWQIGKRKISAIPNDKFNNMSANDLLKDFTADLRQTIPTMEQSLQDITPLVEILIRQYGDFARKIIDVLPEVAKELASPSVEQAGIGFEKLFHRLTTSPFPSLPSAGAIHRDPIQTTSTTAPILTSPTGQQIPIIKLPSYQGPSINPHTGTRSEFLKAILSLPSPASHIVSRRSNVSLQSLTIERNRQYDAIAEATRQLQVTVQAQKQGRASPTLVNTKIDAVNKLKQQLSNFLKMHGARF